MPSPIAFDPVIGRSFVRYARLVANRGYIHNTLGNIVIRAPHPDHPHGIAYTKHAEISLEEMDESNVVITEVPTSRILHGTRMTSVGHNLSREILRLRPDVNATIHVHDDAVLALYSSGAAPEFKVLSLDPPFVLGKPVHFVPAHVDVEADVSSVADFIADTNLVVLVGHGLTALGRNISEAYHRLNTFTAEVRRCIEAEQIAAVQGTRPAYRAQAEIEDMYCFAERIIYPVRADHVMADHATDEGRKLPTDGPSAKSGGVPIGTIVLLVLAFVLYAGMMGSIADSQHSDAAGRGLAMAFGAIFASLLLVDLAILLVVAAVKGRMSVAGKACSFVVLPAALIASWMAAEAYANGDRSAIWVLALMPLLIALYAVRARFAALRALMRDLVADLAMGVMVVVLIVVPLARAMFPPPPDPAAEARAAEQEKARLEREEKEAREAREREAAQFAALGPDSSMADYLPFVYGDYASQARKGMRGVKSRQADTVALLGAGRLRELEGLLEYDVDATPEVCAAYGAALAKETAKVDPKAGSNQIGVAIDLEAQRPNLEWLVADGCDLKSTLEQLEKNLRAVADSSRITRFADEIAKLRSK